MDDKRRSEREREREREKRERPTGLCDPQGLAVVQHDTALLTGMRIAQTHRWRSSGTPCAESVIRWRYRAAADCALPRND